jgi:Cys-rich repeat protein
MATPSCSSGHTCGDMCTMSADCPMGLPVCETATHACVECLVDADCGMGGVCQTDLTCQ